MAIKIYIDQGHNPRNPNAGAEGNGLREQDVTYETGRLLAGLLDRDPCFETRLSRKSPDEILGTSNAESLRIRVEEANAWGADWFVSLHTNASTVEGATGSEAFVYSTSSPAFGLAQEMLAQLTRATGLRDRGVSARPGLYILRRTQMPAVLVEMGFITNPADAALMENAPELFARGLYNGIAKYLRQACGGN